MNTIERYVFRQALGPLLAILAALGAIAILTQGLNRLDIIVDNRQSALSFIWVTLLATPQLMSLILPLAVFFAVAFAINRMHTESETTVLYAAGISPWRLAQPILQLATLAALGHLAITVVLQPAASREMRETIYDIRADVASSLVREGSYTFPADGLTIYARERRPGGDMADLFVHDSRGNPPITYTARTGVVVMNNGAPQLVMMDGQIQRQLENGVVETLDFDRYPLTLEGFFEEEGDLILKPSDRTLGNLFFPDLTNHFNQRNVDRFLAEAHYRLSSPLLNFTLALIALAGLLGGEFSRQGYTRRLMWAAVAALLTRLTALGIQAAAIDDPALNPVQYIFPVLVGGFAAWVLLRAGFQQRSGVVVISSPGNTSVQFATGKA
jgi:lipopolysaccharide export system permease protein